MTNGEWATVVFGGLMGYAVVSFLIKKPPANVTTPENTASRTETKTPAEPEHPWHIVLGVEPSASLDEIQSAHRGLKAQYDPHQLTAMGPELQALAQAKSMELDSALQRAVADRVSA